MANLDRLRRQAMSTKEALNAAAEFEGLQSQCDILLAERDKLEAKIIGIRDVIPMGFLRANDAPGASGPTEQLDLIASVRQMTEHGREIEAERDRMRDLLEAALALPSLAYEAADGGPTARSAEHEIDGLLEMIRDALSRQPQDGGGNG